jgi:CubicO group peptidase (beta-lactamase class C family)
MAVLGGLPVDCRAYPWNFRGSELLDRHDIFGPEGRTERKENEMKTNRRNRILIWAAAALLLLTGLGTLAWFLMPGLHAPAPQSGSQTMPAVPFIAEYWPTDGWRTNTPEQQGFDSVKLAEGLRALQDKHIPINSLLITRNGYLVLDAYFYPYEADLPHDLASVTKSVTTTLIAIAAGQGKVQLDQPMLTYFPERTIANLDDRKKSMTVRHLAGMVNGMESGCLNGDEKTLDAMRSNPDWVQAALDRKMVRNPGSRFCYDSPGMHLLSAILQKTTGMNELDFARQTLFGPLGIKDVHWKIDPQGYTHGWGDLWLRPQDAAKIGYLWLNNGIWEDRQIVPADWVADSVRPHTKTGEEDAYGYGWWVSGDSYFALGRGGQHIKVYPALNAIVVVTGGGIDYDQIDPMLKAAFVDPQKPLPENPTGVAELDALQLKLTKGPVSQSITSLPETAGTISGKTYGCEANAAGVSAMRFEFNDLTVANLTMKLNQQDSVWPIGLDGKYRIGPEGLTAGYWEDSQTFVIQLQQIGQLTLRSHFDGDMLEVGIPERGLNLICKVQKP